MASPTNNYINTYSAPAAACAAEILRLLSRSPDPMSLADLERGLNRTKSLIFRVLRELTHQEFVVKDGSARYRVGIQAFEVGTSYLEGLDAVGVVREILQEIADTAGETANLGVLRGSEVVYLLKSKATSTYVTISHVGGRVPASCIAIGKALLATLPDAEVERRLGPRLPRLSPRSVTTLDALLAQLAEVREQGYALDDEEAVLGRVGLAVPLDGNLLTGEPTGFSVSIDAAEFPSIRRELIDQLQHARAKVTREVLHPGAALEVLSKVDG